MTGSAIKSRADARRLRIRNRFAPRSCRQRSVRLSAGFVLARAAQWTPAMASARIESWTIPFHVVIWTAISVGLIMTLVVVMMH
jgi:hypothetical protein